MHKYAAMWEGMALRGVFAVLLGLAALFWPGLSLGILVLFFAAYALSDGFFAILLWVKTQLNFLLVEGIVGILAGVIAIFWPLAIITVFVYLFALWALITGIAEIVLALSLRKVVAQEIFYLLAGFLSIITAVVLLVVPGAAAVAIVWVVGVYAVLFGLMLIGSAIRLRSAS